VSSQRAIRKNFLILIAAITSLVVTSTSLSNHGYIDIAKVVYGQSVPDPTNPNKTGLLNLQEIQLEKVHVGEIDIAYKMIGKGDHMLLFNEASDSMDA